MNGNRPEWFPDWRGECAAIVGAGPSLTRQDVEKLRDRIHVIVVNTSYELCPWADVLYACDMHWWRIKKGAKDFKGLKVCFDIEAKTQFPELNRIVIRGSGNKNWTNQILMDNYGEVGAGANSSYQACNLAAQFGATALLLLGLDMCDHKGKNHWHGRHPDILPNPIKSNYDRWIQFFTEAVPRFAELGIDVVNCSPISALNAYPKMSIEDAFKRWGL